ncbi:MAG: helix-turn-helix transcriptional regulator [Spirochaetes bacterium]|nr:helix-turn-helix transcriptional regulator [Spirochaetota bacterium]
MRIGAVVFTLRKKKGLTQEQLAWKADIARSLLQSIERGRRKDFKISTLLKLCKGLGTSPVEFFKIFGDGNGHRDPDSNS